MTGIDIVYGKHELTFHRLALLLISQMAVPGRALLENSISYCDSDFTIA